MSVTRMCVSYRGCLDPDLDHTIESIVRSKFVSSGCCLFGDMERDLVFTFKTYRLAKNALARLKKSGLICKGNIEEDL
jgi:hypothetical protein